MLMHVRLPFYWNADLENPVYRITLPAIIKHKFFAGPVKPLSLLSIYTSCFTSSKEPSIENRMLPPRNRVSPRNSQRPSEHSITRQPSSFNPTKRTAFGLQTLLEDLGIADEYRRKYALHASFATPKRCDVPTRKEIHPREGADDQHREKRKTSAKRYIRAPKNGYQKSSRMTNRRSPKSPISSFESTESHSVEHIRHNYFHRNSSGPIPIEASHSRGKGGNFEVFEDDNIHSDHQSSTHKSSNSRIRNALGNIESRLKSSKEMGNFAKQPQFEENMPRSSEEKGFPTMVEELLKTPDDGTCNRLKFPNEENMASVSRAQRSAAMEKGLISLLSNLKDAKLKNPKTRDGGMMSPHMVHSKLSSSSFTPSIPQQGPSRAFSKEPDFAEKYSFSTRGIPPLRQKTKHGTVAVTDDGHLQLCLPSISHNIFSISPNSKQITVRDGNGVVWEGTVNKLPWQWTRVYRYASRFVQICRSRTPRLSVELDGVAGRVMLNGEFEACESRKGIVIRLIPEDRSVKVFSMNDDSEELRWEGDIERIPDIFRTTLESSFRLYKKCQGIFDGNSMDYEPHDTALCVPRVGWCAIRGNRYQFLFEDGVRMVVDRNLREIIYSDAWREKLKWRWGDFEQLPRHVKARIEKIALFRDVE